MRVGSEMLNAVWGALGQEGVAPCIVRERLGGRYGADHVRHALAQLAKNGHASFVGTDRHRFYYRDDVAPPNFRARIANERLTATVSELRRLYEGGCTDRVIAAKMSMSKTWVAMMRSKHSIGVVRRGKPLGSDCVPRMPDWAAIDVAHRAIGPYQDFRMRSA